MMSKFHSLFAISCVLVFTSAQAPTRMSWSQSADAETASAASGTSKSRRHGGSSDLSASALDESGRFGIDASQLPELNVELPELFDWSDDHQSYYVDAKTFSASQPDAFIGAAPSSHSYRVAMLLDHKRDIGFAGAGRAKRSNAKGQPQSAAPGNDDPVVIEDSLPIETIAELTDDTNDRVFEDIITQEIITGGSGDGGPGLLTNIDSEGAKQQHESERPSERPIPVPLPGTLFLFALGLGGFVTSRRKKVQSK